MRVRCVSDYVTPEQQSAFGRQPHQGSFDPRLIIGREYLVLGLTFEFDPAALSTGPSVYVLRENGDVALCDLALFEITDPRASRYWHVRTSQFDGRQFVDVLPSELFSVLNVQEDDERSSLEQDEASFAALRSDEFRRVCGLLESEYEPTGEQETDETHDLD